MRDRSDAVAEVCFADAGRPEERHTKARHRAGGGLEAGRGTREAQPLKDHCLLLSAAYDFVQHFGRIRSLSLADFGCQSGDQVP